MANFQMVNALSMNIKDSRWLQLEVCREYQRNKCSRVDQDCKFAHPQPHVEVQNGKVTACFDSIKGRCNREKPPCKYFHPPQHLKEQLLINGRNNLAIKNALMQQFTAGGMPIPGTMQMTSPAAQMYGVPPSMAQFYTATPTQAVGETGIVSPMALPQLQQKLQRSDRLEVCREFQRGACKRAEQECRYAHPPDQVAVDDGQVTVCMDAVKGRCGREPCRYFHPPSHLQAQLRAPRASPALSDSSGGLEVAIPGRKRQRDPTDDLGEPAYDAQVYFGAFPGVGVYKRPAADKAGVPCYPAHSGAASYPQLMLQQQQSYLHPASCEYAAGGESERERPASRHSAASASACVTTDVKNNNNITVTTNGAGSPLPGAGSSDGGATSGEAAAVAVAAAAAAAAAAATCSSHSQSVAASSAGSLPTHAVSGVSTGVGVMNPALYTGYSLSKAALPTASAQAAASVRPMWPGLTAAVGFTGEQQQLLLQQQQQLQLQQHQRMLQLQQHQRLVQQQYAAAAAPYGLQQMYAAAPTAAGAALTPSPYLGMAQPSAAAAAAPYLTMAGYGQQGMLTATQPPMMSGAAAAAAAAAAYAQMQNGEPALKRMRKM